MLRVIAFLVLAAIVVACAWFVGGLPGHVTLQAGQTVIEATVPFALLILALAFVLFYILLRLIALIVSLPRRMRAWRAARNRQQGDAAITRTLLALAAGESSDARRQAHRARRLLGDTPYALLLTAESARRAGREDEATENFRALADRRDAAFLGLRGLLRQAIAHEDWAAAAELARRAEQVRPGSHWLRAERAQLAMRAGDWRDAIALAGPDIPKAVLATAAAEAEPDPRQARKLAKQAFTLDPTLAPAAIAYARRLREAGHEARAREVIRQAWAANPHPDLADFALTRIAEPAARASIADALAAANPAHAESHLLQARTALEAGQLREAHRHADAARAAGMTQRRLWNLLADIAEAAGDAEASRVALRHAAHADPDPDWRCESCGTTQLTWHPICPHCHAVGKITWTTGTRVLALQHAAS